MLEAILNILHIESKNSDLIYNDILGELRCIYDGEQYFENGKLNKKLLEQSGGVFIDI